LTTPDLQANTKINLDCPNHVIFYDIGVKIWDELENRFGSISFISTASSADEGFINDVEVSDDMNGFGIIDEDDPTEMVTRKLGREKRTKKAKKHLGFMIEQVYKNTNEKRCVKADEGKLQILQP
jgi:hypothetical protein